MKTRLFHIFGNNPLGREALLQAVSFCQAVNGSLIIFIPKHKKCLMNFENDTVKLDLDGSYFKSPETAVKNVIQLTQKKGVTARFLEPENHTEAEPPTIKPNFHFMCCPRSISDLPAKMALGNIGPGVKRIVNSARFPVLLTSPAFKEWQSIAIFFEGSIHSVNALKLGLRISRVSGLAVEMFTQKENVPQTSYEDVIEKNDLKKDINRRVNNWTMFSKGSFEENLYQVPHDALVVLGAFGNRSFKDLVFGSKLEKIQSTLPNDLMLAGPNYTEPKSSMPSWFPSLE